MKKLIATLITIFTLTTAFAQDYQIGAYFNKTNDSIPVVYKANNQGTAGSGILFVSDGDSLQAVSKGGLLGIGTSTPTETLDVDGTFRALDGDSAQFKLGLTTLPFFDGAIDVLFHGAVSRKTFGNWHYILSAASNSVSNNVGSDVSAVNYTNGAIRSVFVDSTSALFQVSNLTNSGTQFNGLAATDTTVSIHLNNTVGNNEFAFINDNGIVLKVDSLGKLGYFDGNQANGYVLTSDASGNASWADIKDADFSNVPVYSDNATAVAAIGAGKLYYTDTSGEYILKITH